MRHPANVVIFGKRLYTEFFLPSEESARLINDVMNIKITGRNILNCVQKLASSFQKISKLYKPNYSDVWYIDEMFINRK